MSGINLTPVPVTSEIQDAPEFQHVVASNNQQLADPNLRSVNSVVGYQIQAKDGDIGHVAGMLFDDKQLAIRYLALDTSNWWRGHALLIPPQWATAIDWASAKVTVPLLRQTIRDAPHYNADLQVNRQLEHDIYRHYGQPAYWSGPASSKPGLNQPN